MLWQFVKKKHKIPKNVCFDHCVETAARKLALQCGISGTYLLTWMKVEWRKLVGPELQNFTCHLVLKCKLMKKNQANSNSPSQCYYSTLSNGKKNFQRKVLSLDFRDIPIYPFWKSDGPAWINWIISEVQRQNFFWAAFFNHGTKY